MNTDTNNMTKNGRGIQAAQSIDGNKLTSKTAPPLTVKFTVNEETDVHTRSSFIPQVQTADHAIFVSNDPPEGNRITTQAHPFTSANQNQPHLVTNNLAHNLTPDIQHGNLKQGYFAEILPDALEVWKSYRNANQREGACRIRAGYMRYLARAGRFPSWTSTMMPPPGMITTMDASLRIVAHRRQQAISSLNLMASILEDKAINHKTSVDLYKEGLKQRYLDYVPYPGSTIDYNYQVALDVAKSLADRDHAELNQKLNADAAILKLSPEAILWSGIEYKFRPRQLAQQNDPAMQPIPQNQPVPQPNIQRGNNMTPVSPLTNMDYTNSQLAPNQVFQSAWGQMGRRGRGIGGGRRPPYNQTQGPGRAYLEPQNHDYNSQAYNQGYNYQNQSPRRRGRRDYNNPPTPTTARNPTEATSCRCSRRSWKSSNKL